MWTWKKWRFFSNDCSMGFTLQQTCVLTYFPLFASEPYTKYSSSKGIFIHLKEKYCWQFQIQISGTFEILTHLGRYSRTIHESLDCSRWPSRPIRKSTIYRTLYQNTGPDDWLLKQVCCFTSLIHIIYLRRIPLLVTLIMLRMIGLQSLCSAKCDDLMSNHFLFS